MTTLWLSVAAFARLRCLRERRARMVLSDWDAAWAAHLAAPDEVPAPTVPRARRVSAGRGPASLQVLAEDVAALYALDAEDVHQLAA